MKVISIESPKPKQLFSTITVELKWEEANLLAEVLNRVGGDPDRSRREISDRINGALREELRLDFGASPADLLGNLTFDSKRFNNS